MAAFDYGMMSDTALELLTEFGTQATLTRVDADDPSDWQSSGATQSIYEVTVVMLPVSVGKADNFDLKFEGNFTMQQARFGYMAVQMKKISGTGAESIQPQPTDIISVNGEELVVIGSRDLNPAGTPVYYSFAAKA
ncbi:hypothetical protein [Pseudochrobactrum asaccharolyticum]|uniref:Uncharacterized protein n=1 Tax=Pseudochrobactrum asaccharolyticum TaxID=354351 RepID=A0A366DLS2_9HYPH|nr:hypothetical protein [Pseudochrobactrum asaccharolyticum]RBO91033.1 hypothetical protein DFR47_11030 [Pseudochrobactrum asaccharolyticum]